MRLQRLAAISAVVVGLLVCAPASSGASSNRLTTGSQHACALLDGVAYCWGSNARGQLGIGSNPLADPSHPVAVDVSGLPAGVSFVSLAAGNEHTCALTSVGTVYCWGRDFLGALGNGDDAAADQRSPVPVDMSQLPAGTTFVSLAAGRNQNCGLTPGGIAYCWGDGGDGGLGTGASATATATRPGAPVDMSMLPAGDTFAGVQIGDTQTCGVTTGGAGYCWGQGAFGQLGHGGATGSRYVPTPVDVSSLPAGTTWGSISGAERHSCGLTATGTAYCWGADNDGQLGNGPIAGTQLAPSPVDMSGVPVGTVFSSFSPGVGSDARSMCAVTSTGSLYCWGSNDNGQVGTGSSGGSVTSPVPVNTSGLPAGTVFTEAAVSSRFACAITEAGTAYCWGQGVNGKLGNGTTSNRSVPTPVVLRSPGQIRITEWMYNTESGAAGEWVELTNVGESPIDLNGWRYDDDSASPAAGFDLSGFGVVAAGESIVFTEVSPDSFRTDWNLCQGVKVIGPYSNNLGRADQINIFDATGALVDRLTYGDQTVGGPRTNGVSAWATGAALGADDAAAWVRSTAGDGEGSHAAASGSIGSPGRSTRAVAAFNPCAGRMRITEWMYNTASGDAGEWVELTNVGEQPVDMTGYSYDDDSRTVGVFGLSGLGIVEPGESVVFTEVSPESYRADWNLCAGAKVVGPYSNNLGRADEINIFDGAGALADRLTYGDQTFPGSIRTQGVAGWVTAAGLGQNNALEWVAATVGDGEGSVEAASGAVGSPGRSTRAIVDYDRCAAGPGDAPGISRDQAIVAGSIGDPENPGATLTLTPKDGGAPVANLVVTATSTNEDVLPAANITITGTGANRTASFNPTGRGTSSVTFTVTDPDGSRSSVAVSYAASGQAPDPSGRYYHRISDASSALAVGDGHILLLNDETNTIFLYREDRTGYPVKTWAFTPQQLGTGSEVDFEGLARSGDRLVLTGSHGNNREGEVRPERRTFVAATITGSGADTELAFAGRYNDLWAELRAWDQSNGHGLGADKLGFVASTAPGELPEPPGGFNVEGLEFAPDGETLYLGFRAPTIETDGAYRALIVPLLNVDDIVDGAPATGPAQFGAPILLDLGGRSIRELRRNDRNEYLISAGPSPQNDSWALYTWYGDPAQQPRLNQELPAEDLLTGGTWESIASVPEGLTAGAPVRLVTDSGDTDFYDTGATKDLAPGYQKSYGRLVALAPTRTSEPSEVDGTVPATLALSLGPAPTLGVFAPGVAQTYSAAMTANVVSTAGDATLTVADPSATATGHLVNGAFTLPEPLLASAASAGGMSSGAFAPVGGASSPTMLLSYPGPVSNDGVTVSFQQAIGATDALRTGIYSKTLTFTLSTTTP